MNNDGDEDDNNTDCSNNNNNDNDNGNYDEQQPCNNEDACAMCLTKFVCTTPDDLLVTPFKEKFKANIVSVLAIMSYKHKFHKLCWDRYWVNLSKKNELLQCPTCRNSLLYDYCTSKHDCIFDDTATAAKISLLMLLLLLLTMVMTIPITKKVTMTMLMTIIMMIWLVLT